MKPSRDNIFGNLPEKLVKRLMPFQREGVEFAIKKNGRCLIADEMGLGKTLQAICVACYYKAEWPLLIIVPSSLRYSWIEEFEKWLPDINPGEINLIQSGTDSSGIENSQVTITTFGLLSHARSNLVKEALIKQAFKVVIVDESHYMKNIKTVTAKVVVPIVKSANRRILLSGTPALARPVELYPQIDAVCPNQFGNWYNYTNRYCDAKLEWFGKGKRRNVKYVKARNMRRNGKEMLFVFNSGASNLEELQQKLSSQLMIRREKHAVLSQLPPKQRQRILFELKDSDLKKEIRKNFDELRLKLKQKPPEESYEVLTGGGEHDGKDFGTLSLIQRLYQLSGDAKIGPAKEYIEMLCDNPKLKFLIFAYHHNMMNGLAQSLYDKKIKFIRIDGHTPPSDRPVLVNQFQSDPDTRVAVLSILAAGVGLTLTAATLVVFAEMYWTPGVMIQCEDRAHRIGQTNHVAVHYLVAKDTMDEWVWSAVCKKTIVTSTTLVGKKRKMEALEGDQYQIDVLSQADAWVPKNNENLDLTDYFNTQLNPDQKSIKDFFSPSRHETQTRFDKAFADDMIIKRKASPDTQPAKKQKLNDSVISSANEKTEPCLIVLDSDSDDDFASHKFKPASLSKSKEKKTTGQKSNGKSKRIVKNSPSTPKCNLVTMFSQASNKTPKGSSQESNNSQSLNFQKCSYSWQSEDNSPTRMSAGNPTSTQWNCTSCTFLNHKELTVCEMCETPKKVKPSFVRRRKTIQSTSVTDQSSSHTCSSSVGDAGDERRVDPCDTDTGNLIRDETFYDNKDDHRTDSGFEEVAKSSSDISTGCSKNLEKSSKDSTDLFCLGQQKVLESRQSINSVVQISNKLSTCRNNSSNESQNEVFLNDPDKQTRLNESCLPNEAKEEKDDCVIETGSNLGESHLNKHNTDTPNTGSSSKKFRFKSVRRDTSLGKHFDMSAEIISGEADKENNCDDAGNRRAVEENNDINCITSDSENGNTSCKEGRSGTEMVESDIPVYPVFKYTCSKYTGRIYLLSQDDAPLNINFIPIDVEVYNHDALPDILHHPQNLRLVQKFVREWQNLTETKRRVIIKAGRNFISPTREYEELQSCKTLNTDRHKSKNDTAVAAHKKAAEVGGSVRVICKTSAKDGQSTNRGITQALDKDGTPLCVQCFKPFKNSLLQQSSIISEENAWQTRFCSEKCAHNYWLVTNNEYIRNKMYEIEHGVCQMCQYDAHALFTQIRDTQDHKKRAELVSKSKYNSLTTNTKQQIVKKPVGGQFWHVDHIVPVWEGGGQCDMDNLRTLCVPCHHKVTARQAGTRATARKLQTAVRSHDITAFFKKS